MVDIHSHLIPNVDDGSRSFDETFKMFHEAEKAGFTDIILTPHYILNYYENSFSNVKAISAALNNAVKEKGIDINLYPGMEVYITSEMQNLIQNGSISGLAGTKYMLIELPMNSSVKYLDNILFVLDSMGYKIILAHPERYPYLSNDIDFFKNLVQNKNVLLQCNYGSIIGMYGKDSEKMIRNLLKEDLVHFLATDCHRPDTIYAQMPKILKKLEKILPERKLLELTTLNAKNII